MGKVNGRHLKLGGGIGMACGALGWLLVAYVLPGAFRWLAFIEFVVLTFLVLAGGATLLLGLLLGWRERRKHVRPVECLVAAGYQLS